MNNTIEADPNAPKHSPWGFIDECHKLKEGVYKVTTPSHGGIFVSREILDTFPDSCKFEGYSGSINWFEEDCDASIPLVMLGLSGKWEDCLIKTIERFYCKKTLADVLAYRDKHST